MDVLFSSGRKIHTSLGDGNCLFRTFSREFLSNETYHLRICTLLTDVVKWNGNIFHGYLTPPVTGKSITEPVHKMQKEFTHGELMLKFMQWHQFYKFQFISIPRKMKRVRNITGKYFNHEQHWILAFCEERRRGREYLHLLATRLNY